MSSREITAILTGTHLFFAVRTMYQLVITVKQVIQ